MLPGVSNAGLWRVCYDAPVIPATLEDGNQSFDALLVELSENPTAPAAAVVGAQATASDAPRRMADARSRVDAQPPPRADAPRRALTAPRASRATAW